MAENSWNLVLELLHHQRLGVLGTSRENHPYGSLVAFSCSGDARQIYFATTRSTRKYHHLSKDHQVSLLIDNRENRGTDYFSAAAITAYGRAVELAGEQREAAASIYLQKHPQLESFIRSPSTALFGVTVETYHLVQRFQNVTEFRMTP